jgi:transposase, IS5 family
MPFQRRPGFFDVEERAAKLTEMGDPLVGLNAIIDWEAFRPDLNRVHEKERKSQAGAKPSDVVLMFKLLILQQLHNLSDDGIEYQVRDRLSFMRFLGLQLEDRVPDAKTVWLYRERLKALNLIDVLFARFHEQLAAQGYVARAGQMIDATFVEVPRQCNSREENAKIKAGEIPEGWDDAEAKAKRSQRDTDARWTKKNNETHYGYKNHINADLLDQTVDDNGDKRPVYADSAYRSKEHEETLADAQIESQVCEKGTRGCPLSEEQK